MGQGPCPRSRDRIGAISLRLAGRKIITALTSRERGDVGRADPLRFSKRMAGNLSDTVPQGAVRAVYSRGAAEARQSTRRAQGHGVLARRGQARTFWRACRRRVECRSVVVGAARLPRGVEIGIPESTRTPFSKISRQICTATAEDMDTVDTVSIVPSSTERSIDMADAFVDTKGGT